MKRLLLLLTILLLAVSVRAQTCVKYNGIASQGGKIITSGITSTTSALKVFPNSTVTVYNPTGTTTLASIFSNSACSVVKANPFTASASDASFSFYIVSPVRVDLRFSGTGITNPFTISDTVLNGSVNTALSLLKANNLSDLANTATSRTNLGLTNAVNLPINVSAQATAGAGTSGSPWTGWDTAITWAANTTYYLPSGYYSFTTAPNWALTNIRIYGDGPNKTVLVFTGTGVATKADAGSSGLPIYGFALEQLSIRGNASATTGIYLRAVHHVFISNVEVRDVTGAALETHWDVLGVLNNFRVSQHNGVFTTVPTNGMAFDKRASGEQTTAWSVLNPIIEGTSGDGIVCTECATMQFIGGSSEGNAGRGMLFSTNAQNNTVTGMDCEANAGDDYTDNGTGNTFINVISGTAGGGTGMFRATTSTGTTIIGGRFNSVRFEVGAAYASARNLRFNVDGGGSFFNAPADSDLYALRNVTSGTWFILSGTFSSYDEAGTVRDGSHAVTNSVVIGGGGTVTVTLSGKAVFSSAGSYGVTATDLTAAAAVGVVAVSGTQFTITGTAGHTVYFTAIGN